MTAPASLLIFFMDGVGLGSVDPTLNPLAQAQMHHLTALLGPNWYAATTVREGLRASLAPTDATLGIDGRPQSATGQASILTGRNVPALVGKHYGPKPNKSVAAIVQSGNLFGEVVGAHGAAALLTPYPPGWFAAIESGRRLLSAVPLAAKSGGVQLQGIDALRRGEAVSPDLTNAGWRQHLGFDDVPLRTPAAAGAHIAHLARQHRFSFFEHWPSDYRGHRGTMAEAVAHMEMLDEMFGGLLEAWDDQRDLLIITSDHGNIEEKAHRQHTRNPVPTIVVGPDHVRYARNIRDLTDIAGVVRTFLGLPTAPQHPESYADSIR